MVKTKYTGTNWSPYITNPIDYIANRSDKQLVTPDGELVSIELSGMDFVVVVGGERYMTFSNINTCYFLNQRSVGFKS